MRTWLNNDFCLHIDMLKQQVVIGKLLIARFYKEERYDEAYGLTLELMELFKTIWSKR
jgi:hypothetical protein